MVNYPLVRDIMLLPYKQNKAVIMKWILGFRNSQFAELDVNGPTLLNRIFKLCVWNHGLD
jgi:hypothetical protein